MIDGIIRRMDNGDIWIALVKGCPIMPEWFAAYLESLSEEQKNELLKWVKGEDFLRQELADMLTTETD